MAILKPKEPEYKQAILIREDLGMSKGKIAVQAAHASVLAVLRTQEIEKVFDKKIIKIWNQQGMKKVVLKVTGETELFKYKEAAERASIKTAAIKDAGMTELAPGTYTALALGPDKEDKIDEIVGKLETL